MKKKGTFLLKVICPCRLSVFLAFQNYMIFKTTVLWRFDCRSKQYLNYALLLFSFKGGFGCVNALLFCVYNISPVYLGDNRIVFEDLPTYIGGLSVANLVWPATRQPTFLNKKNKANCRKSSKNFVKFSIHVSRITLWKLLDYVLCTCK